jgi:hypothetical protein
VLSLGRLKKKNIEKYNILSNDFYNLLSLVFNYFADYCTCTVFTGTFTYGGLRNFPKYFILYFMNFSFAKFGIMKCTRFGEILPQNVEKQRLEAKFQRIFVEFCNSFMTKFREIKFTFALRFP